MVVVVHFGSRMVLDFHLYLLLSDASYMSQHIMMLKWKPNTFIQLCIYYHLLTLPICIRACIFVGYDKKNDFQWAC